VPPVAGEVHPDRGAYLGSFIVPPDYAKQFGAMKLLSHRPDGEETGFVLDDAKLAVAMKKASAFDFLRALPNMPSSHLSIQTGYQGPACTYLGSDSSGLQAMAMAVGTIRSGQADAMVAGGAFFPFQEVHLSWQQQRGLWSEAGRSAPYSADRDGTLPGEGAALLFFEERESALARGATILAEVIGAGQRILTPGEDAEVDVRAETLEAALPEGTPDWIGPSGLGHRHLDKLEAHAYTQAFGAEGLEAAGLVTAVPQVGFTGPAAGPLNLVGALLAALGECEPARQTVQGDADTAPLAAALARNGRVGDGAIVLGSSFSYDGVHAALALRAGIS
jgi:nodulation protein E